MHVVGSGGVHAAANIAGAVLTTYNPGLGSLFELIANAVFTVEHKYEGMAGAEKKEQVKAIVDVSAPVTVSILQHVAGTTIKDPTAIAPAIDALIDDVVELFNGLGIFNHHQAAPGAKAPQPAAIPHSG